MDCFFLVILLEYFIFIFVIGCWSVDNFFIVVSWSFFIVVVEFCIIDEKCICMDNKGVVNLK